MFNNENQILNPIMLARIKQFTMCDMKKIKSEYV